MRREKKVFGCSFFRTHSLSVMDSGREHPHPSHHHRLLLPQEPPALHQHHFHHSSHRDQLFTSFISLVVFLFLLIVVLLLSPHVHGQETDEILLDSSPDLYSGWDDSETPSEDMMEDRMDSSNSRNRTTKVPAPRVKRVEKSQKTSNAPLPRVKQIAKSQRTTNPPVPRVKRVEKSQKQAKSAKTPVPSKKGEYELMTPEEIKELYALLSGGNIAIKKKKSMKILKTHDRTPITRRGSVLDRQQPPQPRPRQPREPPVTAKTANKRIERDCPWCEVSVANAGSSGSESRYRPSRLKFEPTYSDSSIPPDEDEYDRQVRFIIHESKASERDAAAGPPRKLGHFQSRTNGANKHRVPIPPSVEYEPDVPEHQQPLELQEDERLHHVLHVIHEEKPEAEEQVAIVAPGEPDPLDSVYYKHEPEEAAVPDDQSQAETSDPSEEQEGSKPDATSTQDHRDLVNYRNYLKSTIEYEKQILKEKRPVLKSKHPLLKHFPKFFSYLDQEDGLDKVPEDSDDEKEKVKKNSSKAYLAALQEKIKAQQQEEEDEPAGEAMLIPTGLSARPPVSAVMPPLPLQQQHQLPAVLPPHPLAIQPELHDDGIPKHHYSPQLSTRRPLLLPSLRLGLRLAMPLRPGHPHQQPLHPNKLPTSMLNHVPELDYKTFDPLPRKLGSKVADRFYSANIVQDIGLVYAPKSLLTVKFNNGAQLCLGNPLSVLDSFTMPALSWAPVRAKGYHPLRPMQPLYTMIMLDPDIPLMDGQYVHWLMVNIPSPRKKGTTIVNYINPLPIIPAFGALAYPNHRYVFLVFAQTKPLSASKVKEYVASKSTSFKLRDFVKYSALESQPVAGNFFFGRLYVKTKTIC